MFFSAALVLATLSAFSLFYSGNFFVAATRLVTCSVGGMEEQTGNKIITALLNN